jgi:hypothetical protein
MIYQQAMPRLLKIVLQETNGQEVSCRNPLQSDQEQLPTSRHNFKTGIKNGV